MTVARPFATGTEQGDWMDLWCGNCRHDHNMHRVETEANGGCDIALMHVIGEPVDEWTMAPEGWRHIPALMVCSEFGPCPTCGDGGPRAVELRLRARRAVSEAPTPTEEAR